MDPPRLLGHEPVDGMGGCVDGEAVLGAREVQDSITEPPHPGGDDEVAPVEQIQFLLGEELPAVNLDRSHATTCRRVEPNTVAVAFQLHSP